MNLFTGKPLPWIYGGAIVLAVIAAIVVGLVLASSASTTGAASPDSASSSPSVAGQLQSHGPGLGNGLPGGEVTAASVAPGSPSIRAQQSNVTPASVTISPAEDYNPIRSQHTFTIEVEQADGSAAPGAAVELILNRFGEAVGDIVSINGVDAEKVDNTFGRVTTDDNGEATLTITATREGDTDVTAYVPGIADPSAHKVFAVKHWVDMIAAFPEDASNLVGTEHPMAVTVSRVSDGSPLEGVPVIWSLTDGTPDATLNGQASEVSTVTDASGVAAVVLEQVVPETGDNTIYISVLHSTGDELYSRVVTKTWQAPSLNVTKDGPASVGLSRTANYVISVTNEGDRTATGVTLTDTLPAGMSYVSADPEPSETGDGTVVWSLGDLDPAGNALVSVTLSADAVGEMVNEASAMSTEGFTGAGSATTMVIPGSLTVTKTGPESANITDIVNYEITVTKDGEGALTDVTLTDTVPEGLTFFSGVPGPTQDTTWNLGTLEAGDSQSIMVAATADTAGDYSLPVSVTSAEGATADTSIDTTIVAPDLAVTKAVSADSFLVGEEVSFTIEVTNNGDGPAFNAAVVDTLSADLTVVSSDPEATVAEDGTLNWTIDELAAGASATFTITVTAADSGDHTNTVSVTVLDTTATAEASVTSNTPSISLEKTGGSVMYTDGERNYMVTATNDGETDLTGVVITDTLPVGLSFVSADSGGTHAAGVVTWNIGDLAMGDSVTVTVRLSGSEAGMHTNAASVTSDQAAADSATFDVEVRAAAGASLVIVDDNDPIGIGEQTTYTITVTNQGGDAPVTDVNVTVVIPDRLTIVYAGDGFINGQRVTFDLG
ncbi:MAG: DUF11 domain-containing protein, partial [Acidimicrobiaceae bacterium]|nr:DUF11 domain-containing protein [Acidimicrobiaceae bacterium]